MRRAVLDATIELLQEDEWAGLNLARVAQRAGVQPSSVYRRWGSVSGLVSDTLGDIWSRNDPVPDTGSLRADVHGYAAQLADDLASPLGRCLVRGAVLVLGESTEDGSDERFVRGRVDQVELMLARGRERGEPSPAMPALFETVIGPLYAYALFAPGALAVRAAALADRFLALPVD